MTGTGHVVEPAALTVDDQPRLRDEAARDTVAAAVASDGEAVDEAWRVDVEDLVARAGDPAGDGKCDAAHRAAAPCPPVIAHPTVRALAMRARAMAENAS